MKVKTEFEIKHFVAYMNANTFPNKMDVLGREGEFHVAKIHGDEFKIHEDALPLIQTKCPSLTVNNKIVQ